MTWDELRAKTDAMLEGWKAEMMADIAALVAIPSLHGDLAENTRALDFVLARAEALGMRTFTTAEHDVGVAEIGDGDAAVGILAHVDVVDVGDLGKWRFPPYDCREADGYLWGRGTEDDKGPVIMGLYAMRAMAALELPLSKRVQLIIGTCEEGVWSDIDHYKAQFPLPDYGFTPDGAFPIGHGENGYADVCLTFREQGLERIEALRAGKSPNTVPSLATVKMIGGEERAYHGRAVHSSAPHLGDNAIVKLCREDAAIQGFAFCRFINRYLAGDSPTQGLGIDDGGTVFEGRPVGPSRASATVLEKDGDAVTLNINFRQRFGVTRQGIEAAFSALAEAYGFTYNIPDMLEPVYTDNDQPPFRLMDAVQQEYGLPGGFHVDVGSSYVKAMPNMVSWGPILPKDGYAHMENERYGIDIMMTATKAYCSWLVRDALDIGAV